MKAVEVKNESYEPRKLEAIYQNLFANNNAGRPQDYAIELDGFSAVGRNNDPERFMSYADFISPETKYISVLLYRPNSNTSDKYYFHIKPNQFFQPDQLKGLPNNTEKEIPESEQKEKWRKELHYEELIKENAELRKELEEMEIVSLGMEKEIDDIKHNRDLTIQSAGTSLFKGFLNLPMVKDNIPFASDLAGTNTETKPGKEYSSFKRKGQEPEDIEPEERNTKGLTKEEKAYIQLVDDIRSRVGEVELETVMHLLDMVTKNPQSLHFAIKQVTNYLKQKPKPSSDEKV